MRAAIAGAVALLVAATASAQDGSARALLQQARQQSNDGQPAAALETLRRARALAPNSEEVLSAYAMTALAARSPIPAIAVLEPLTRMCPTVADYHYLLGVALLQAGDPVSAVDPLRAAESGELSARLQILTEGALPFIVLLSEERGGGGEDSGKSLAEAQQSSVLLSKDVSNSFSCY